MKRAFAAPRCYAEIGTDKSCMAGIALGGGSGVVSEWASQLCDIQRKTHDQD